MGRKVGGQGSWDEGIGCAHRLGAAAPHRFQQFGFSSGSLLYSTAEHRLINARGASMFRCMRPSTLAPSVVAMGEGTSVSACMHAEDLRLWSCRPACKQESPSVPYSMPKGVVSTSNAGIEDVVAAASSAASCILFSGAVGPLALKLWCRAMRCADEVNLCYKASHRGGVQLGMEWRTGLTLPMPTLFRHQLEHLRFAWNPNSASDSGPMKA